MTLGILVTPTFNRAIKKLHARDKKVVDMAVGEIAENPKIGEEKKGDLVGVFVHKIKINKQEVLLAYSLRPDKLKPKEAVLLSFGSHENFYSDLKK
jgi:mRNA-degrading endonuclease RelE of RelBE toxin-antitoxin system